MAANESELEAKLRVFHERKKLANIEKTLDPILADGLPVMEEAPSWVAEATGYFWEMETEPDSVISDEAEPDELAEWTEGQLARYGIGSNCYIATHLSVKPWISCAQVPGWTKMLRSVIEYPIVALADDASVVVAFIELEYDHAAFTAAAELWQHGSQRPQGEST